MSAAALLVVGFANAADFGFDTAISYAFLVVGGVLAVATVVHSVTTTRNAIFPRVRVVEALNTADPQQMLRNRTAMFFTFGSFMNSLIFMPVNFLLPQYFQGVSWRIPLRGRR